MQVFVMEEKIFIAIGSNQPCVARGCEDSLAVCLSAVARLRGDGVVCVRGCSSWYYSEPVPRSEQAWFVNGVVAVTSHCAPRALLAYLHDIEHDYGRVRHTRNEARPLDLDLLAYGERVMTSSDIVLPHPRIEVRSFVLYPIRDVMAHWCHPVSGMTVDSLLSRLPAGGAMMRLADADGTRLATPQSL